MSSCRATNAKAKGVNVADVVRNYLGRIFGEP